MSGLRASVFVSLSQSSSVVHTRPNLGPRHRYGDHPEFNPLKGFLPAQEWCNYHWPQPAETVTHKVDRWHPKPTTIYPPRARDPNPPCRDHDFLCRLYQDLREANGICDHDEAKIICACIEDRPTVTIYVPASTTSTTRSSTHSSSTSHTSIQATTTQRHSSSHTSTLSSSSTHQSSSTHSTSVHSSSSCHTTSTHSSSSTHTTSTRSSSTHSSSSSHTTSTHSSSSSHHSSSTHASSTSSHSQTSSSSARPFSTSSAVSSSSSSVPSTPSASTFSSVTSSSSTVPSISVPSVSTSASSTSITSTSTISTSAAPSSSISTCTGSTTFENAYLMVNTTANLGGTGLYPYFNQLGDNQGDIEFTPDQSLTFTFSLDGNGILSGMPIFTQTDGSTSPESVTAAVEMGTTNTVVYFSMPDNTETDLQCGANSGGDLTCIAEDGYNNNILYYCDTSPYLQIGTSVPPDEPPSGPDSLPTFCGAVTFKVESQDGTPIFLCPAANFPPAPQPTFR